MPGVIDQFFDYFSRITGIMMEQRLLGAVVIMVLFAVLALLVDFFIHRIFDHIRKKSKVDIDNTFIGRIHRPAWITLVLVGALLAVTWLGLDQRIHYIATAIIKTLLIIVFAVGLGRLMKSICHQWWVKRRQGRQIIHMFENVGRVLVLLAAVSLLLLVWKIDISPLLASAGIVGLAVALAARDTLANFFGGINIFLDKPFMTGDYIILESGERGEVVEIGVRSTLIRTRDDEQISIPNSIVANTKIINESAPEPRYRVRIKVGVAYDSNLEEVEAAMLKVAAANQSIAHAPEARVRFRAFGDSSLDFELLCWAKTPADRGRVIHELNLAIFSEFQKRMISIPFPQQDVYMHPMQTGAVDATGGERK
ncbi:MAG: mechanosensitive ion channel family protein [Desulfobacterales bacterium]|nr:mechanosensitive ion channel family protein [Desulfobacterales bacterium]